MPSTSDLVLVVVMTVSSNGLLWQTVTSATSYCVRTIFSLSMSGAQATTGGPVEAHVWRWVGGGVGGCVMQCENEF